MMTPGKAAADQADQALDDAQAAAGSVLDRAKQSVKDTVKDWGKFIQEQLDKPRLGLRESLSQDWQALKDVSGAEWLSAVFKAMPGIAGAAPAITKGVMLLEISKLLHRIGDLQASQEALMGLIEMLEQLLKRIQTGMSDRDGFITSLQQMYANIYKAADQTYGKMLGALEQHG